MNRALRWGGVALLAVGGVVAAAAMAVYVLSARRLQRVYPVSVIVPRTISAGVASHTRGKHIATAMGSCTLCHAQDLGREMLWDDGPMGTLAAPTCGYTRRVADSHRSKLRTRSVKRSV